MMLYTRKGDTGTTKTFGCDQRVSKSSSIAEALGSLDEINSFLGLLKIKAGGDVAEKIGQIQQDLFIIQAELAGAPKTISPEKIKWLEEIIDGIEKILPPIKTFFVSGGVELAALSDIARTIARRAERRVVAVVDEGKITVGKETLVYLNRLSSILYAFARNFNHQAHIAEEAPRYSA
ncbi:ATP:cob(I)alamin adenosyltransferase [Candidatus Nomurabacteria bacterium RIFCSPHIGHO2_01_FULL_39_220]|uniref:Corrinoid adenosyltransferase n=1 Tax=Candidatus Nomurabacteria bacterium RIFCSPLOWO2_02_FULL_40_67 TaxID=1801787 RepID=A0A1F6Y2M8_9BACT|nr:MAG: ATP:cob(I)alamin adenosyltransferase [Candidatus Nomurabacteria bacterium RBG_16_40_11]OGI70717.1 MAG: ATP:cob(I)alamin adenosyltransferase [Candidatus Nomurabacteria bacterium RIFCSPHIGHO2_01_FULL_39_220]OGI72441.1 MAG: ATP:cob(I)alamin adenosyltransferase [Candidatus Nomurabacteria bacterium RIFCSPHIGHO2_02_41_18]OGI78124.1 MAG: ATP:cob(I)alamin adenosyltransferase [Candidatus Nomurabacteria bacterium RIFCSPHIGHO2_02_FULL_41_150]OGI81132.1 MAG: ATP:cob(I)alamin adenosyltransferase [Ca